ncbi:MAG: dihydroorotase [Planctomycetota bacterium]|jgi:dihydroorotase
MANLLIQNGTVIDPSQGLNDRVDLRVVEGRVAEIAPGLTPKEGEVCYDASGCTVVPGLVDAHVHFREPGNEEVETMASGAAAAAAGGFTSVACMPNTDPAMDNETSMSFVALRAQQAGLCNIYPVGAITKGRKGTELAEMGSMVRGGAVAFSDDGSAVPTAGVLRRAMEYANMLGRVVMEHCEDLSLAGRGVMHEGEISARLGLPGIPAEAEEMIVARDIMLANLTGARLHLQHLSTAGSVEQVRQAKARGLRVTAEVTPHHLFLTHEDVTGFDPSFKMNPPLRTHTDTAACLAGVRDGTIDMISSDHAPHATADKEVEFSAAAFGAIGLESTLGMVLTNIVHRGEMSLEDLLPRLTTAPAALIGIDRGTLKPGVVGDVTVVDVEATWTIDPDRFASKGRNCPFAGRECRGRPVATFLRGRQVYGG